MKKLLLIFTLILSFVFVSCGGNKFSTDGTKGEYNEVYDNGFSEESTEADSATNSSTENIIGEERKIIKRAEVYIESLEFDKSLAVLENNVTSFGGYIESSDIYQGGIVNNHKIYRDASFTVRIPKESFESFLDKAGDIGVITNKNVSGEDISSSYFDKESRLKVLKAQEERYIELIGEANNITEVLEVEKYLTEVRGQIESITGYLDKMDELIDYSTVTLSIQEVEETSVDNEEGLGSKIVKALKNSINSLKVVGTAIILTLVSILPYLIIIMIIGYIVYMIVKKSKKENK